MKKYLIILLNIILINSSCINCWGVQDNKLSGNEVVTFIIKHVPKNHDFNSEIYISGDFEGWSGGNAPFKLKKENLNYHISIPKYQESINFKFTNGHWKSVECSLNGKPIENRRYTFAGIDETITLNIENWTDSIKHIISIASENVHIFSEDFKIPQLNRKRKVSVYLPPNYQTSKELYPVLYIQDGQNIFDDKTSYSGEWEVDETLNNIYNNTGFGLIVVAIDHGEEKRLNEYAPWNHKKYGKGEGKAYVDFLVNTLKPKIDDTFRTKEDSQNTAIIGSSLGGLIAHYAVFKYPNVFGKAGVFSPSFWYTNNSFSFTKSQLQKIPNIKIYYLVGHKEGVEMVNNVKRMSLLLKYNGFPEKNIYKKMVPSGMHNETFWKSEFNDAIIWLFKEDIIK